MANGQNGLIATAMNEWRWGRWCVDGQTGGDVMWCDHLTARGILISSQENDQEQDTQWMKSESRQRKRKRKRKRIGKKEWMNEVEGEDKRICGGGDDPPRQSPHQPVTTTSHRRAHKIEWSGDERTQANKLLKILSQKVSANLFWCNLLVLMLILWLLLLFISKLDSTS